MRWVSKAALAFGMAAITHSAAVAAWPEDRPIEVVVGFAAGGGTDVMARKLLPFVQKQLGGKVQFVVVNKPGASGEIANAQVARAKPDGYTIGVVNVPSFVFVPMTKKAQYEVKDFVLISRIVDDPTVLVSRSDNKVTSLPELLAALREKQKLSFGHNGVGTNGELALQMLSGAANVEILMVPYKGTAAQKTDLLGGHLDFALVSAGEVPELYNNRKADLRAIIQFVGKRSAALPQIPTAAETGVSVLMSSERGFAAPAETPAEIIKKLDDAIGASIRDPEFIAAASSDAPVLAYLPGKQWEVSLEQNRKMLERFANQQPKQ